MRNRFLALVVASCLVLQTPWGAQATRFGPPYKGGHDGRHDGRNDGRNNGPNGPDLPQTGPPSAVPNGTITMARASVLAASVLAATLSNLAYPTSVLSFDDALASYTDPAAFQKYTEAVTAATRNLTSYDLQFVQRLATSFRRPSTGARFVYAFIMPTKSAVYVAFRGTDTAGATEASVNFRASVGVDGNSKQMPYPGGSSGNVHTGFYISLTDGATTQYDTAPPTNTSAYHDIKAAIQAAQTKVGGANVPLILTGHSLGAAQAALAAYMLTLDGFTGISLYTFGMPQVGELGWRTAFDNALGGQHNRWWNMQDPIPQYPNTKVDPGCTGIFNSCTQDWYTVDTLYRIDKLPDGTLRCGIPTGTYRICDATSTISPLNEQKCYADIDFTEIWDEADHSLLNYLANLQACSQGTSGNVGGNVGGGSNGSNGCKGRCRGHGRDRRCHKGK